MPCKYVPDMGNTGLFSIRKHMQFQGCLFHAEAQHTTIAFPSFILKPHVGKEIDVLCVPAFDSNESISFDQRVATRIPISQSSLYLATHELTLLPQSCKSFIPPSHQHHFTSNVLIPKLVDHATIPTRATKGSIGFDVKSLNEVTLQPGVRQQVSTGLAIAMPSPMYLRIAERSGLAMKGIAIKGGVVDSDYRGDIKVIMCNETRVPITIPSSTNIAQFIFEAAHIPFLQLSEKLPDTKRSKGGFGSTDASPSSPRIQSVRINNNEVLIVNKSKHRPILRKMKRPVSSEISSPQSHQSTPIPHNQGNQPSSLYPSSPTPPLSQDRVNSALPKRVQMSKDALLKSIGFLSTRPLLKHMKNLSSASIHVPKYTDNPGIDPGTTASMNSRRRNTTPSNTNLKYSDIWHVDIGYGPSTGIGGMRYTLLCVDKATRYKFVFGLKNLNSSILAALKQFINKCGEKPKLICTDFDPKLFAGDVATYLTDKKIEIEAAPPYRQHQNGLVERSWQTIVNMTRNWLTSAQLPSKYWYFGVKRACEVLNILPSKKNGKVTTPYQLVHGKKVDYRNLFPMFTVPT